MKRVIIAMLFVSVIVVGFIAWRIIDGSRSDLAQRQSTTDDSNKIYSLGEIETHGTVKDCWTIINDSIYDLSSYINRHPGGEEIIRACGKDSTTLFTERRTAEGQSVGSGMSHSQAAEEQLKRLKIGTLLK